MGNWKRRSELWLINRNMNILRPLSPHLPIFRHFLYSFVIILTFLGMCYSLFSLLHLDFSPILEKLHSMLLGRSLYLLKVGPRQENKKNGILSERK